MLAPLIIVAAVVGYLLGALPFGYLVARARGVDIFKAGSGNPGATNVKRVLGAKAGNMVFALDVLKGALAAGWPLAANRVYWICRLFDATYPFDDKFRWAALAGLIASVLGHSFSVFTRLKGGKGVATAAGGVLVLMPAACLAGVAVWAAVFCTSRYVSLASVSAAVAVSAASWLLKSPLSYSILATALGLFVIVRHSENIERLLKGTENKFARKPPGEGSEFLPENRLAQNGHNGGHGNRTTETRSK